MKDKNSPLSRRSKRLAPILYQSSCLDFGEFTLTSGKKSPYYVDLRLLPSYPRLFDRVADMAAELVKEAGMDFEVVSAVPTGGLPFATMLSQKLKKPLTYARKSGKSHGEERKVEGKMEQGDRALVVDDIITTGGSILEAVESIRMNGGEVEDVLVILDRTEGGKTNLRHEGLQLHKIGDIGPVVEELKDKGKISRDMSDRVEQYLAER